jgi:hypothetical protein
MFTASLTVGAPLAGLTSTAVGVCKTIAAGSLILVVAATALVLLSALDAPRNSQAQVSPWPVKRPNAKRIASSNISKGVVTVGLS